LCKGLGDALAELETKHFQVAAILDECWSGAGRGRGWSRGRSAEVIQGFVKGVGGLIHWIKAVWLNWRWRWRGWPAGGTEEVGVLEGVDHFVNL
jgi:hypothetical protein